MIEKIAEVMVWGFNLVFVDFWYMSLIVLGVIFWVGKESPLFVLYMAACAFLVWFFFWLVGFILPASMEGIVMVVTVVVIIILLR